MKAKEVKRLLDKAPEAVTPEETAELVRHYFTLMEEGEEAATPEALAWSERLVAGEEAGAGSWILRGLALFWAGAEGAEEAFSQVLELAGEMEGGHRLTALYHLGKLALRQGDLEAARERLEEARRLDPTHLHTLHDLAVVAWRQGDQVTAMELLKLVVGTDPDFPGARKNLAKLSFREEE